MGKVTGVTMEPDAQRGPLLFKALESLILHPGRRWFRLLFPRNANNIRCESISWR